jgi:hypothetical protein
VEVAELSDPGGSIQSFDASFFLVHFIPGIQTRMRCYESPVDEIGERVVTPIRHVEIIQRSRDGAESKVDLSEAEVAYLRKIWESPLIPSERSLET